MLRSLSSLWLFPILVDVWARLAVQTHATELNGSPVECIVSWHDHRFLLLLDAALEAGASSWLAGCTIRSRRITSNWRPADRCLLSWQRREVARIHGSGRTRNGLCSWRVGIVWQMLDIFLSKWVLGRHQSEICAIC